MTCGPTVNQDVALRDVRMVVRGKMEAYLQVGSYGTPLFVPSKYPTVSLFGRTTSHFQLPEALGLVVTRLYMHYVGYAHIFQEWTRIAGL